MRDGSNAFAVWLTGLPASGKSKVAAALTKRLLQLGIRVAVLESDVLRQSFSIEPSYDAKDRDYFYGSLAFIGKTLVDNGISVIFDATANRREYRDRARTLIPDFFEIYIDTPREVCIQRDPKGIYERAQSGAAQNVPGLGAEYEPPLHPDLVIHGDRENPTEAAERIIALLNSRGM